MVANVSSVGTGVRACMKAAVSLLSECPLISVADEERLRLGHWLALVLCVPLSAMTQTVRWLPLICGDLVLEQVE